VIKDHLRLKPSRRLSKAEAKLHETREAAKKKLEGIERRVHGKEEPAKKAEKGKLKEHVATDAENDRRASLESHKSAPSIKTQKSGGIVEGILAAVEGRDFITVDAPSKALTSSKNGKQSSGLHGRNDDDDSDYDDDLEENAFNHPSTYQDQPWIWIPQWEVHPEISAQLVEDIKAGGVDASDIGAIIDDHGTVWVKRSPPDEDWDG
jgi:hypothetical protein